MSKYTTEVRFICENAAGLTDHAGFSQIDEIIMQAIPKVFDFDFPIFDEAYRNVLCKKILKHYYTREICAETVGLWKLWLDTRMNEIMPYYNKLYESELLEFNPLYDVDITTTGNRDNTTTGKDDTTVDATVTDTSNSSSETSTSATRKNDITGRDLYSDTPQGALDNVENEDYLTNARKKTESENGTDSGTSNGSSNSTTNSTTKNETTVNTSANTTEEYLQSVKGKQGGASYSKLLMEYRKTFINIDMQVIESLSDLFFGLW